MRTSVKNAVALVAKLKRPTFIMMIGVPGSGKSTFVNALLEAIKPEEMGVASTDFGIEAYAKANGITYSEAFKEANFKKINSEMKASIDRWVKAKQSFLWDQTNVIRSARGKKLRMIPADFFKVAVSMEVPEKVLFERLDKRAADTGKHIDRAVVGRFFKQYETPLKSEGFDAIYEVLNG